MVVALNKKWPITEAHFDGLFPRGSSRGVLVLKDEHGRILATEEVDKRDEETVKPFLQRMKALDLKAFYIDGCKAYYNAIRSVFGPSVAMQLPMDRKHPEPFHKVTQFLEEHFEWMAAYLRHEGIKHNSAPESGMRVLRRLEVEHDGFRSEKGRSNCLRIYQAVKYLGWTVHRLPTLEAKYT